MENKQVLTDNEVFELIDFKRFVNLLRRNLLLLIAGLVFSALAAFMFSRYQTPIYEAKTQVMVTRSSSDSSVTDITQTLNVQQLSQTYVELLSQEWVRNNVGERIGAEIKKDQVKVSAATNTQIIDITVEDPNPSRAMSIADMLVQVLIEQNESIQSNRYSSAEASLDVQIQSTEQQIAELQAELEAAEASVVSEQIAEAQAHIVATQNAINDIQAEITKIEEEVWTNSRARLLVYNEQARQRSYQATLDKLLSEYQALESSLPADIPAEPDETIVKTQSRMAELGIQINAARDSLAEIQKEIDWLTPLTEADSNGSSVGIEKALAEKQNELAVQEALLESYKTIVTQLLATNESQKEVESIKTLQENLDLYKQIYLNLLDNREAVRRERLQNIPSVVQLTPAIPSKEPVRPRTLLNTALGAVAGLVLAVSIVLLVDILDTTLKTREDIERVLKLPVMGYALQMDRESNSKEGPYVLHAPRSPAAEAFRSLRTNLEFIGVDQPIKSLLVSSPGASEGKTTVVANLAAVIAQGGKRVVMLDADLRRPRLHQEMGLVNRVGLSDVFRNKISLSDVTQPWGDLNLSVVTSGGIPPNPSELLGSEKMRHILDELESRFDFVIIDSTPTIVTDSQLIAARVDGVLLVIWPGRTHAETARLMAEQYRRVGAHLLGVVMNNIQPGQSYGGYTSYSGYNYYRYAGGSSKSGWRSGLKLPWNRPQNGNGRKKLDD